MIRIWIATSSIVLLLVAATGCARTAGGTPEDSPPSVAAADGAAAVCDDASLAQSVAEEGVIEAVSRLTVTARKRGQVTWLVEEGSIVEKGDRVLEMDHEDLLADIEDVEVSHKDAQAQVADKQDNFADQKKELEQEVEAAQGQLELARFKLKVLNDGPTPAVRGEAKARVERTRATFTAAKEAHDRTRGLTERGVISEDERLQKWTEMERAGLDLKQEEVAWRLLVRGPEPVALAKARLDIQVAELNHSVAAERLNSQVAALRSAIDEAKLNVARLQDRVRRLKRRIRLSVLQAPGRGMVVYGMVGHSSKSKLDIGSRVWPGMSLITLPDLSALKVSTQVGEEIVGSLRVGQRLPIRVVSIDGARYTGEILRIDIWGQDRNELLDETGRKAEGLYGTKVYHVDVKIVESDPRLNIGFKARVYFPRPAAGGPGSAAEAAGS